jgi:(p)ppGpp synthase/HD superfamily hydrolase
VAPHPLLHSSLTHPHSALRKLCLAFYDVRATVVEVVARLDLLCSPDQPSYEQQVSALEALQMYAPMGHALGLGRVAQQLEDRCFQVGAGWKLEGGGEACMPRPTRRLC